MMEKMDDAIDGSPDRAAGPDIDCCTVTKSYLKQKHPQMSHMQHINFLISNFLYMLRYIVKLLFRVARLRDYQRYSLPRLCDWGSAHSTTPFHRLAYIAQQ